MIKFKPGDQVYIKPVSELRTIWKTDRHGTLAAPGCAITLYMQNSCNSFDIVERVHSSGYPLLINSGYYWPPEALELVPEADTADWAELF